MDKVEVQACINKQKDDLSDPVPDVVEPDPGIIIEPSSSTLINPPILGNPLHMEDEGHP